MSAYKSTELHVHEKLNCSFIRIRKCSLTETCYIFNNYPAKSRGISSDT